MDKKTENAINEFFAKRKFLTEEEFQKKMKPDDCMTYKEIKEKIYKPEIVPKEFFIELSSTWLSSVSNPKKTKTIIIMHSLDNYPFEQLESASNYCKFALMYAIQDSHIEAGNYNAALFIKFQNLQNAFIWWLAMRDKFGLYMAYRTEVETKGKGVRGNKKIKNLINEIKEKTKNSQYAKEFKSLFDELEDYMKKYYTDKNYTWNGESYSLSDIGNDSKHNEDVLTKILNEVLSGTIDYFKFEYFFYRELVEGLLIARNEFLGIAGRFIELFEKYIKNCMEGGPRSFAQS